MPRLLIGLLLIALSLVTVPALWRDGYFGIVAVGLQSFAGAQVFTDLIVMLVLILVWLWHDARKVGRSPWPWIVVTLVLGGFGPLLYLLTRPASPPAL